MLQYPDIDPVALSLGPLRIHWYGLMYLLGFAGGWWLARARARRAGSGWTGQQIDDLLFYAVLGVILGGRLGYMLFYSGSQMLRDPWLVLRLWEGGMSFHGGLIGVLVALWLYSRRHQRRFFAVTDFFAPLVPIGLGAGRIGNFINGELWGKATTLPWGMRLPCDSFPEKCLAWSGSDNFSAPLHPTQLYEAFSEGLLLFLILWAYSSRPRPTMAVSGMFLLCYGAFRIGVELLRVPDAQLGYLAAGWLTMGQILSFPMVAAGALLLGLAYRRR